jgi:oligopeptide/dipeptide ABC transporter ATP-binding protein
VQHVNPPVGAPGQSLAVRGLTVEVQRGGMWRTAVNDVSFTVGPGERVAVVGESGSGKSLTALSLVGLLPPGARVAGGVVELDGVDLLQAAPETLRRARGRDVGFVFQNPMSSLDPLVRVGTQIQEALLAHRIGNRSSRAGRAVDLLERVGVRDAGQRARDFPHQFSGGMRQRVMIAAALAAQPSLLIADEPTTALDVTVQAQILTLLRTLSQEDKLSLLMITHDLAVARQIADRVLVMYAGRVLEDAPIDRLIEQPHHPYSEALLNLVPEIDGDAELPEAIPGAPIPGWEAGAGCPFVTRCAYREDRCATQPWGLHSTGPEQLSACVVPHAERGRRDVW